MRNPDIKFLFGVEGDGGISEGSGLEIATQIESIVNNINGEDIVKIKFQIDPEFKKEINELVEQVKTIKTTFDATTSMVPKSTGNRSLRGSSRGGAPDEINSTQQFSAYMAALRSYNNLQYKTQKALNEYGDQSAVFHKNAASLAIAKNAYEAYGKTVWKTAAQQNRFNQEMRNHAARMAELSGKTIDTTNLEATTEQVAKQKQAYDEFIETLKRFNALQLELVKLETKDQVAKIGDPNATPSAQYTVTAKQVEDYRIKVDQLRTSLQMTAEQQLENDAIMADFGMRLQNATASQSDTTNDAAVKEEIRKERALRAWKKLTAAVKEYYARVKDAAKGNEEAMRELDVMAAEANADFTGDPKQMADMQTTFFDTRGSMAEMGILDKTPWQELLKTFSGKMRTLISGAVIMLVARTLRQVYDEVVEIDDALTQMKITTKASDATMQRFAETATKTAKKIGVAVSDLIKSATEFARLGYNIEEASKFAELTTMYSRVTEVPVDQATKHITAIIKAYNIGADQLENVMDKLIKVGNLYPVSPGELGEALNEASSILAMNGNTLDQALAILTAANEVTQDISKSATAVRTMAARLTRSSTELEALGESSDGLLAVSDLAEEMKVYGIAVTDAKGELLSTYDILRNIHSVWADLGTTEKAAVAELVAGTRQQSIFASTMASWKDAEQVVVDSANATGELQAAQEIWIDSITGRMKQLEATTQSLSQNLLDGDLIKGAISGLNVVISLIDKIVQFLSGAPAQIALISASLFAIYKYFPIVLTFLKSLNIQGMITGIKNIALQLSAIPGILKGIASGSAAASSALTFLSTGTILVAVTAITALIYGISKLVKTSQELREELNDQKQKLTEINTSLSDTTTELDTITKRINTLQQEGPLTFVEQTEIDKLKGVSAELKYQIELEKIRQQTAKQETAQAFTKSMRSTLQNTQGIGGSLGPSVGNLIEAYRKDYASLSEKLSQQYADYLNGKISKKDFEKTQKSIESLQNTEKEWLTQLYDQFKIDSQDVPYFIGDNLAQWQIDSNKYLDYVDEFNDYYMLLLNEANSASIIWGDIIGREKWQGAISTLNELADSGDLSAESLRGLAQSNPAVKKLIDYLVELGLLTWDNLDTLALQLNKVAEEVETATSSFKSYLSILQSIQSDYDMLSSAIGDMDEYGALTADTISKLLAVDADSQELVYNDLVKFLRDNDLLKLTTQGYMVASDALDEYLQAFLDKYKQAMDTAVAGTAEAEEAANAYARAQAVALTYQMSPLIAKEKEKLNAQKDALESQLDAYQELIDVRKSLLQSYADELAYQKELAKKQKTVSDLETKLAVAKLDTSAAGRAKARSLQDELSKAKDDLEEFSLEHAVDVLCNELDLQYQQYKLFIEAKVQAIIDAINNIKITSVSTTVTTPAGTPPSVIPDEPLAETPATGTAEPKPAAPSSNVAPDYHNSAGYVPDWMEDYAFPLTLEEAKLLLKELAQHNGNGQYYTKMAELRDYIAWLEEQERQAVAALQAEAERKNASATTGNTNGGGSSNGMSVPKNPYGTTYHTGGIVGGSTPLKDNEEFAKLLKGEYVATPAQMRKFMQYTLPNIASTGGSNEFHAPLITITCESVTKDSLPSLKDIVNEAVEEIKQQFDGGFSRTGYRKPVKKLQLS